MLDIIIKEPESTRPCNPDTFIVPDLTRIPALYCPSLPLYSHSALRLSVVQCNNKQTDQTTFIPLK